MAGVNITVLEFEQPRPYVTFTVTETDGSFSFTTQEGTFVFQITTPLGSGAASATIAGVSLPATIEPERGFDVRGRVVDESGNPFENVGILAAPPEGEWINMRTTASNGSFGAGLRPGIYDIVIGFFGPPLPEGLVPRRIRNLSVTTDTDLGDVVISSGQTIGLELSINPRQARLTAISSTVQLEAAITFSDGTRQDVTASAQWSSSDTSVATVTAHGLAIARGNGTTTITAISSELTGTMALTVAQAVPVRGVVRLRPQLLAAGFDPTLVDFDDSSFDVIAIVRPGVVPVSSVTVTQNQGTFSISMEPGEGLPGSDLVFRKTFNFRRGSFGEQVLRALWGDEPGEFNITVIDQAQGRHSFPDLEFGNQPSIN